MKNLKKVLALVLAVVMIMGTVAVASAKDFKDVKATDDYAEAIDVLSNLGIIDGFTDGEYKPEGTFTRAQAAKMVAIVHNAATNGYIKGQDGISELYANAQNAFTDCAGNWAVAYINYCRATGLLDGITRTTYAPNSKLTGVQWLKLMLTTLNFDTDKEGYLGAGWDINVLNRANEIGLLEGLPESWKGNVPVTRGEAAQILYNALTAYLVEYGQLIKSYGSTNDGTQTKPINASFVSNEQVNQTGLTLAKKMGVGLTYAHDVFMRPGYVWSYGGWKAFYLKSAVKSYTGTVNACDLLVDLGIAKTSKDSLTYVLYRDGRAQSLTSDLYPMSHVQNKCEAADAVLGGNGTLTQVFKVVKNKVTTYVITVIDTYLSKTTKVNTTKHGMTATYNTEMKLYVPTADGYQNMFSNNELAVTLSEMSAYAAGDYVLYNVAVNAGAGWYTGTDYATLYTADTKIYNNTNADTYQASALTGTLPTFKNDGDTASLALKDTYFVPVQIAETIASGKYTGRSLPAMDELTVNGTKYNTNRTYTLDEGDLDVKELKAKTLDFFVDQYGNLIGDVEPSAAATTYGVLDGIYWTTAGVNYSDAQYAVAGLVKAGESSVTDIKAASHNGGALKGVTENENYGPNGGGYGKVTDHTVSTVKANNVSYVSETHKYGVVSYTVNANDTYNLQEVGEVLNTKSITQTNPNLGQAKTSATYYVADENTSFLVKTLDADGNVVFTPYEGIAKVPTIKEAKFVVAVKEASSSYAKFVYVDATNAIFAGSTAVAFVGHDYRANYEDTTARLSYYNVYINGVKTTVEADRVLDGEHDRNMFNEGIGLYTLEFNSEGKLVKATWIEIDEANTWKPAAITETGDIVATTVSADKFTLNYTDATIYIVSVTGQYDARDNFIPTAVLGIKEGTKDDVKAGVAAFYKTVSADANWMVDTLYVLVVE